MPIFVTIVPRQIGQLWDELLESILSDVCLSQRPILYYKDQIPYTLKDRIHTGRCYQQYTSNLCGYHATFNTLCFLTAFGEFPGTYDIQSASSFWSFKKKIQRCLFDHKHKYKLKEEWPWRDRDILYGDFQRVYNRVCLEAFKDFDVFRQHNSFDLRQITWQFQYQNLLLSEEKRRDLNREIQHFKAYSSSKPLVLSIMLAITNHWMCMQAIKIRDDTEYWFFDSKNKDILSIPNHAIATFVEELNLQRVASGKEPMSTFSKDNTAMCIRDTQTSVKLIIDCLEGRETIDKYVYNQQFNVFANHIHPHLHFPLHDADALQLAIKEYWHNIYGFFSNHVKLDMLTPTNAQRYYDLLNLKHSKHNYINRFHQIIHKQKI